MLYRIAAMLTASLRMDSSYQLFTTQKRSILKFSTWLISLKQKKQTTSHLKKDINLNNLIWSHTEFLSPRRSYQKFVVWVSKGILECVSVGCERKIIEWKSGTSRKLKHNSDKKYYTRWENESNFHGFCYNQRGSLPQRWHRFEIRSGGKVLTNRRQVQRLKVSQ